MNWKEQAEQKLRKEIRQRFDRYGEAMKAYIVDALLDFAGQNEEFAQAIAQGGSLGDCLKDVAKGVKGNAISDLDACRRAAAFYFRGAEIRFFMEIHLAGEAEPETQGAMILDLTQFL